jgi:hypothetical protein
MNLTLTARELARMGRDTRTYALRMTVVVFALVALVTLWYFGGAASLGPDARAARLGAYFAVAALVFQLTVVFLIAPLLTSGLIAEERRDNTLTLLLLADMRGPGIFLAKFVPALLQIELLLMSTLPIIAFAALFGGVSVPLAAVQVLLLSVTACAVCALSLLCSSLSTNPRIALFFTFVAVGGVVAMTMGADWVVWFYGLFRPRLLLPFPASTLGALVQLHGAPAFGLGTLKVISVSAGIHGAVAVIAAWLTVLHLPTLVREGRAAENREAGPRHPWGKGAIGMNRVGQLLAANVGGRPFADGALFAQKISLVLFVLVALVPLAGWLSLTLLAAFTAASSLAFPMEQGIIADLQMTPLNEKRLIRTLVKLAVNRAMVFAPAFVVAELQFFYLAGGLIGEIPRGPYQVYGPALMVPMLMALGVARFACVVTMACAAGTSKGNAIWHAALTTFAVLPLSVVAYGFMALGLVGYAKGLEWERPGVAMALLVVAGAGAIGVFALSAMRYHRLFAGSIRGGLRRHPLVAFQRCRWRGSEQ